MSCTSIFKLIPLLSFGAQQQWVWALSTAAIVCGWYVCFSRSEALLLWWDSCRKTTTFYNFHTNVTQARGRWPVKPSLWTVGEWKPAPYAPTHGTFMWKTAMLFYHDRPGLCLLYTYDYFVLYLLFNYMS